MSTAHSAPVSHPPVPTATEDILQLIYQGTTTATGEDFFHALTRATASAMQVRFCFVAEFAGCRDRVRTLAYWKGRDFTDNIEFDLDGTVCEEVFKCQVRYYPEGVAALFPREKVVLWLIPGGLVKSSIQTGNWRESKSRLGRRVRIGHCRPNLEVLASWIQSLERK